MQKHIARYVKKARPYMTRSVKTAGLAAAALLIFASGVGIGNGDISFARLSSQNGTLPNKLDYSSVNQVYQAIKANYDGKLTETQLLDGMKAGLAQATGDPYTEFFSTNDATDFNNELQGSFTGIGAELGQDSNKDLIVVAPIDGFPAAKAGLRAQDIITSIDGQSTVGMTPDTAVSKIRGKKGTTVALKVLRNKTDTLSFTITREDIKVPSVNYKILDGNIGYMQITQFSDDTAGLATKAAQEFKDKGVKGVVLDMRDNPGGLLTAAVSVSSLWLPQNETILQEKRGGQVIQTYQADGSRIIDQIPTVVLINGGSASAAEITAGALHDNGQATLMGVKSFGKGSVQQITPLTGGAEIKVTVARWYRPNGQNIDKKGITPDTVVPMTDADYTNNRDPQLDAATAKLLGNN
ncbi:MAG: S41 family peptidase [Candidatus Saccharibacteria bacterium]